MSAKQDSIKTYQAAISAALDSNSALNQKNSPLKQQVNALNGQISAIDKEISTTNKEITTIDNKIAKVNVNIQTTQNALNALDNKEAENTVTDDTTVVIDAPATDDVTNSTNNNYVISENTQSSNPFLAISYDNTTYNSMLDALNALAKNNEQNIESARTQDNENKQEIRQMFQELIA